MKEEDLELAKQEFNRDRDRWTDLLLNRRFYYADLLTRIIDRQINHILTLSTIAIAIISIVFPLIGEIAPTFIIPFTLLSLCAIIGTGLVLYTIFKDKRGIPKRRDEELKVYSKFQSAANQNYSKAYSKALTWDDVKHYSIDLKNDVVKDLTNTLDDNRIVGRIVDILYVSFLAFFFIGVASFLLLAFCN